MKTTKKGAFMEKVTTPVVGTDNLEKGTPKEKSVVRKLVQSVARLDNKLKEHINDPAATIMVQEKDGSWGEWTGSFLLSSDEKLDMILPKLEKHFEKFFKVENSDKKFAIFTSINGQKKLHKIL